MTLELRIAKAAQARMADDARQADLSDSLQNEYRCIERACDWCLKSAIAGAVVGLGLVALLGRLP